MKPSGRTSTAPSASGAVGLRERRRLDPMRLDARASRRRRTTARRGQHDEALARRGRASSRRRARRAAARVPGRPEGSCGFSKSEPSSSLSAITADGVVPVAELDRRVRDERLDVLLAELGIEPHDVARVRLLDGELGRPGAAPPRTCPEAPGSGAAVEHQRELPREIVRVRDARVASEASGRRHVVGGVAGEEDPPVPEPLGPVGARVPLLHVLDLDVQVRRAERLAHVPGDALVAHVRPDVSALAAVGVGDRVDDEEARVPGQREAEEALQRRPEHVDHAQVAVAEQRLDVGAEIDGDALREARVAPELDAEAVPHRGSCSRPRRRRSCARTVRSAPAVAAPDDSGHAVLVLVE